MRDPQKHNRVCHYLAFWLQVIRQFCHRYCIVLRTKISAYEFHKPPAILHSSKIHFHLLITAEERPTTKKIIQV